MSKKEKRLSNLSLIFSIFLFLCAVINVAAGNIGAAIGGFGSGFFYLSLFLAAHEKDQKAEEATHDAPGTLP